MEGPWEIAQADLQELVEASEVVLEREVHRLVHEGDWRRWGSRGGRETLSATVLLGLPCWPCAGGGASRRRS
jgi:hypothetical protein